MRLKLRQSVEQWGAKPPTYFAMGVIEALLQAAGRDAEVTSMTDGVHSGNKYKSLHYRGLALDFKFSDWKTTSTEDKMAFRKKLLSALNPGPHLYDVVLEHTHFHVEYDPHIFKRVFEYV